MIQKSEERKSDLRNTTVLEVIIAVILVLMLVVYSVNTKNDELKNEKSNLEQIYKKEIAELKKELKEINSKYKSLKIKNNRHKRKIKELEDEIKMLEQNITRGVSGKKILGEKIKELQEKIKKLESVIDRLKLRISILLSDPSEDELEKIKIKYELLKKENEKLKKKIKKLTKGGKGQDLPRCRTSLGEIDVLLSIVREKNNFKLELLGDDRIIETLLNEIVPIKVLENKKFFNDNEFRKLGNDVIRWGNDQIEKCRFYAKIKVNPELTTKYLLMIEKYFYKQMF